jgi:hypothetical protein
MAKTLGNLPPDALELIIIQGQGAIAATYIRNFYGNTSIHNALFSWSEEEQSERVKLPLKYASGFDHTSCNALDYTGLHSAAIRGPELLKIFLDTSGVDVDCRSEFERTRNSYPGNDLPLGRKHEALARK